MAQTILGKHHVCCASRVVEQANSDTDLQWQFSTAMGLDQLLTTHQDAGEVLPDFDTCVQANVSFMFFTGHTNAMTGSHILYASKGSNTTIYMFNSIDPF